MPFRNYDVKPSGVSSLQIPLWQNNGKIRCFGLFPQGVVWTGGPQVRQACGKKQFAKWLDS